MTKEGNISTRNSQLDSFAVLVSDTALNLLSGQLAGCDAVVQFVRVESVDLSRLSLREAEHS